MNEEKKKLIEYYNDCKGRSLILGVEMPDILFDDVFIISVTNDDKVVLEGILQEKKDILDNYVDKYTNFLVFPDVFDIIESLSYIDDDMYNLRSLTLNRTKRIISSCLLGDMLDYKLIVLGPSVEKIGYSSNGVRESVPFENADVLMIGENNFIEASDYCFKNSSLIELKNNRAEVLGNGCFERCTNLKIVDLPNLLEAGHHCFEKCKDLESVHLGKLKVLNNNIFCNCSSLKTVDGLSDVTFVGDCSFTNTKITELDLRSCSSIGKSAFEDSSLRKIKLSDKLVFVDMNAFYNIKNSFFDRFIIEWYGSRSAFNNLTIKEGNEAFQSAKIKFM